MGIRGLRWLVAVLAVSPSVVWQPAPAVAGAPAGASGGCGEIHYKKADHTMGFASLCSAPSDSAFHADGRGTTSDPGCTFPRIKIFEDGTPHLDPTQPGGHYITEPSPTKGQWRYVDKSDWPDIPFNEWPPPHTDFDTWRASFPTYSENAGGQKVFEVDCVDPTGSQYIGFYNDVTVSTNDSFWLDLPGQLDTLRAKLHLETPKLAFTPGSPDVWGGFLSNAPYGVSLGNDIWAPVHAEDVDTRGVWHLTVVAHPVSAMVIVKSGSSTKKLPCALGVDGPVEQQHLPRFDPPSDPLVLPSCAFTARWSTSTSVSVSMEITYRVVGFIENRVQAFPDQPMTSAVQTWPVVRTEAANAQAN